MINYCKFILDHPNHINDWEYQFVSSIYHQLSMIHINKKNHPKISIKQTKTMFKIYYNLKRKYVYLNAIKYNQNHLT